MLLLDSDVAIDLLRGYQPAIEWAQSHIGDDFDLPGFVAMELLSGCANKLDLKRVLSFMAPFKLFWPTSSDFDRAIAHFGEIKLSHNINSNDVLIGETAVGLSVPLVTFSTKHFDAVPNLVTEQPYAR